MFDSGLNMDRSHFLAEHVKLAKDASQAIQ
jgi:hypothetical protein